MIVEGANREFLHLPPVNRPAAWLLALLGLAIFGAALWVGAEVGGLEATVAFGLLALLVSGPFWLFTHVLGRRLAFDDDGIFVHGAIWGTGYLSKREIRRLRMLTGGVGGGGERIVNVRAGLRTLGFTDAHEGCFEAARRLLDWAEEGAFEVSWGSPCDEKRWFDGR
ncbi:hypothetical protein KJ940_17960 [Myxococcota bacterium]|nr:hypothetical protein [Myxococcota bacterium]